MVRLPNEQDKGSRSAERRDDHNRQRSRREAVEDVAGVGAEHEDADERHDAGDHGRADGTAPEVLLHLRVVEALGVPREVDRREICDHDDREDAAQDGGGVDPAVPRVAGLPAGRDPARGDRARDRTHAVRHEHRRRRERGAEVPSVPGREHGLAEREARAADHDPERCDRQRHEECQRDGGERLGEGGPQHDEAEDQPDVVGLPDGSDGVVDEGSRTGPPIRASGGQVPEARAEVRAAEERVRDDPEEEHHGAGVGPAHGTFTSSRVCRSGGGSTGPRGPYGTSVSSIWPPASRHRRLMPRRTRIVVTATTR